MNVRLRIAVAILLVCVSCALVAQDAPEEARPPRAFSLVGNVFAFGFLLQIAAVIHWSRKRPDTFWLWIIIIGGFIGALAYFLIEGAPDFGSLRRSFKGPARRRRIRMLRAMVLDNPSAGNFEELGELLLEQKRYAEAVDAYDRALAAQSDSIDPVYRRALALFACGESERAARDLAHVLSVDPRYDYSNAACLYARTLALTGRTEEALAAFERLLETSHAAPILYEAAALYADHGRAADARAIVERLIAREITMPSYQKRRDRAWLRKAKALRRRLENGSPVEGLASVQAERRHLAG